MITPSRMSHVIKTVVPAVLIIYALYLFGARVPTRDDFYQVLRHVTDEKKLWTSDLLENEVGGPFDGAAITALCKTKQWNHGALVFSCDPPQGGPGHVRNAHLNCIRLAIEAGAELILPDIVIRSADLSRLNVVADPKGPLRGTSMDYLYDKAYLKRTLSAACPQLRLHDSLSALSHVHNLLTPVMFNPEEFPADKQHGTIVTIPEFWRSQFFMWLDEKSPLDKRRFPLRVHFPAMDFYWPVASDGPAFARNFGKILRPRDDARRLAATALFEMNRRFGWQWDPRHDTHLRDTFIGVHLRTEKDAGPPRFMPYADQSANYFSLASKSAQSVIFLAAGRTATNVHDFIKLAEDFAKTTVTKRDLLPPEDVHFMDKMTFDQQALIDFEILLRSGLHLGPANSSFSWGVALRRGIEVGWPKGGMAAIDKARQQTPLGNIRWKDQWGVLYGLDVDDVKRMAVATWP